MRQHSEYSVISSFLEVQHPIKTGASLKEIYVQSDWHLYHNERTSIKHLKRKKLIRKLKSVFCNASDLETN
jgi:hypothetical protein